MQTGKDQQDIRPIKNEHDLKLVQETLLDNFRYGRRNYTIFQLGMMTMLRVSDVLKLKYQDIYDEAGNVKDEAYVVDKKTNKPNKLYVKKARTDLSAYQHWLTVNQINSEWLFPSLKPNPTAYIPDNHINERQFYRIMYKVADLTGINHLGTHTMRKTGAYKVYEQTHNIALVMKLLNHSSEAMTLAYLGLDQTTIETALDNIDF